MSNFVTRALARYLVTKLIPRAMMRKPDFEIGPAGDPYMRRWWLIKRNPRFNIYLHHILHDDDDRALHDHPWVSLSLCLDGKLSELSRAKDGSEVTRQISCGDVVYRSSTFAHRLSLVDDNPSWTIFITGPKLREWGFLCPKGWVHYKVFTDSVNPGAMGRGCGEVDDGVPAANP
jgi:hypothetical protein